MSNPLTVDYLDLLTKYNQADCEFASLATPMKRAAMGFQNFNETFLEFNLCWKHMMERIEEGKRQRARVAALHRSYRQKKKAW